LDLEIIFSFRLRDKQIPLNRCSHEKKGKEGIYGGARVRHETDTVKRQRWPVAGGSGQAVATVTEPNMAGLTRLTPRLPFGLEICEKAGLAWLLLGQLGCTEK
jgi:hypothetical protein